MSHVTPNKPVIEIKNLAKVYNIGHELKASAGTVTLRDTITNVIRKPAELITGHKMKKEKFWALEDINLNIKKGDVVGLIGKNGSGKSTLLKILSRIVEPTSGEVIMRGKTASLLEVGTGFHPELTGRENIYFNGSILGMKKKEIEAKFDEIVAFSEVEKFLDTPVKFYSSGMYVRLAFAVAAHLEPDILIVDEVLAVGDAAFQTKCLGKMKEVAAGGRTVLFVSHNMSAVQQLCNSAVYLKRGSEVQYGSVSEIIKMYLSAQGVKEEPNQWEKTGAKYETRYVDPLNLHVTERVQSDQPIKVSMKLEIKKIDPMFNVGIAVYDGAGSLLFWSFTTDSTKDEWPNLKVGINNLTLEVPARLLNEGVYSVELLSSLHNSEWLLAPEASPRVGLEVVGKFTKSPYWVQKRPGVLALDLRWEAV